MIIMKFFKRMLHAFFPQNCAFISCNSDFFPLKIVIETCELKSQNLEN